MPAKPETPWPNTVTVVLHDDATPEAISQLPGHPDWRVRAQLVRQNDQWVIGACTIEPSPGAPVSPGGLTARQLRRVNLGALTRSVINRGPGTLLDPAGSLLQGPLHAYPDHEHARTPRPGRRGRDDLFYAVWAARYLEHATHSRRPILTLAEQYHHSPARIRDHLQRARRRQLLTPAPPGRSGGALTHKAQHLLNPQ